MSKQKLLQTVFMLSSVLLAYGVYRLYPRTIPVYKVYPHLATGTRPLTCEEIVNRNPEIEGKVSRVGGSCTVQLPAKTLIIHNPIVLYEEIDTNIDEPRTMTEDVTVRGAGLYGTVIIWEKP